MENRRFILIALMAVVLFFIYQSWQEEHAPTTQTASQEATSAPASKDSTAPSAQATAPADETQPGTGDEDYVTVVTDVYRAQISLRGAELREVDLLHYPVAKGEANKPVELLSDAPGQILVYQSGLADSRGGIASSADVYQAAARNYRLADGQNELSVTLTLQKDGVTATKTYHFKRDDYAISVEQTLTNQGQEAIKASPYQRFTRTTHVIGQKQKFMHTFTGVGFYKQKDGDSYVFDKFKFDDLDKSSLEQKQNAGWIGMLQHYFSAVIIPQGTGEDTYTAHPGKNGTYVAQVVGSAQTIEPGQTGKFDSLLYIGPTLQDRLASIAPGLELTVDYGLFKIISQFLFKILAWIHGVTGNWGLAIVALTLLVKLALFKLSEAQYRSTAKMRKYAPRIQELRERYGADREKMSKAMMELYSKEGFNPLAGCWPLLVQMPIFLSLYWVLVESVELRQAPFILWINDLTAPDPFFVLPVLYGLSMWATQRLSGQSATMDPTQQKLMNVMPIALTGFFAFFPAGLVLYWVVSNLSGLAQQLYITRKLEREGLGKTAADS